MSGEETELDRTVIDEIGDPRRLNRKLLKKETLLRSRQMRLQKKKQLIFCLSQVFQHQIKLQMYPDEVLVLML